MGEVSHILIFYVNVGGLNVAQVHQIMAQVKAMMDKDKPKGWVYHYFPVQTETRVECVNPQIVSKKEYGAIQKEIDMMNQQVADTLKNFKNES